MDNSTLTDSSTYDNSTDPAVMPFVSFYGYTPNLILPIVVAVLFLIMAVGHTFFMFKRKAFYMVPFLIGVYLEVIGYIFRRISIVHQASRADGLIWFLIQSLCIILAPALMAATHYMIFGRLITFVGESYSPVRAKRVTLIFVIFDVFSFVVQGGGGSLYASDNPNIFNTAKTILILGFLIQIISFGIFGIFAVIYQIRAKRAGVDGGNWSKCLYTLYLGCILILIRSIFRTIEFGSGVSQHGYLLDHEAWYYALETLPILLVSLLFLVSNPSFYISSDRSLRLNPAQDNLMMNNRKGDIKETGNRYIPGGGEQPYYNDHGEVESYKSGRGGNNVGGEREEWRRV